MLDESGNEVFCYCAICHSYIDTVGGQPVQGWCRVCKKWVSFFNIPANEGEEIR